MAVGGLGAPRRASLARGSGVTRAARVGEVRRRLESELLAGNGGEARRREELLWPHSKPPPPSELEAFLAALFPEPGLFARLYLAYVTTSACSGTGNTRLTGKAFEADVGRGWAAKAGWRWEEENFMLVDLNRRHRDATNMLHKVKLILAWQVVCISGRAEDLNYGCKHGVNIAMTKLKEIQCIKS